MDLKRMRYFCTIAEQGQVSRAARLLHIAQPPLSQRLRELEAELGTPLFLRKGRSLSLTEAGQVFYRRARDILHAVEASRDEVLRVASQPGPVLRIGLSPTCRAPWLARFDALVARFPGRPIGLVVGDSGYLEQLLRSGQLDVAFMQPPLRPEDFRVERLLASPNVAVLARARVPAGTRSLGLEQLARHPLLLLRRSVGVGSYERLLQCFHARGLDPRVALYSSDVGLLRDLLAGGFAGVAVVPESERGGFGADFVALPLEVDLPDYQLSMVCPRESSDSALVAGLLALWQTPA